MKGGLGTYCWTSGGVGKSGVCADTFAIITTDPPLVTGGERSLEGHFDGQDLTRVDVTAYPVGGEGGATIMGRGAQHVAWSYGGEERELPVTIDGSRFEIDITSPATGQYVVSITCYVKGRGDANYGFFIDRDLPVG